MLLRGTKKNRTTIKPTAQTTKNVRKARIMREGPAKNGDRRTTVSHLQIPREPDRNYKAQQQNSFLARIAKRKMHCAVNDVSKGANVYGNKRSPSLLPQRISGIVTAFCWYSWFFCEAICRNASVFFDTADSWLAISGRRCFIMMSTLSGTKRPLIDSGSEPKRCLFFSLFFSL